MPYRGVNRPAWLLFLALIASARQSFAADDVVRIDCEALTPDDAAQVEARTRATLLTGPSANLTVSIECRDGFLTVLVAAGELSESSTSTLPEDHAREAVLAAIERTLAALERQYRGAAAAFPPETSSAPAGEAAAITPPPPARERSAPPAAGAGAPRARPSWIVAAGGLGESWAGTLGVGARLGLEHHRPPWSIGAAFGWLTTSEADAFRANEIHAALVGALVDGRITGLRGSLGAGISVLSVTPDPDLVVRSRTTVPTAFLDALLSRPIWLQRVSLLPAAGVRLFAGERDVRVDATRRLVLPRLCPSLFLGVGYRL